MKRFLVGVMAVVLLAVSFGGAFLLQHRALEKVRKNPPFIEKWQLAGRSGETLRLLSMRYDLVAADFLWLRAIQSFGGRGMTNRDWKPLYNLFDTITELDPEFEDAYSFGNMVIGDEGGHQREALGLVDKGMFKCLRRYKLPFDGMYVAHWEMDDVPLARWYGRIASKRVNAPDWVPRVAAYIEVKSGNYYIGFDRFVANLMQALQAQDVTLEQIAVGKIRETAYKWHVSQLVRAVDEYTSMTGTIPSRIDDLTTMPAIKNFETISISRVLAATEAVCRILGREGLPPTVFSVLTQPTPAQVDDAIRVISAQRKTGPLAAFQNILFKYCLVPANGIPEAPERSHYVLNMTHVGSHASDALPVMTEAERQAFLEDLLRRVRNVVKERKEELGRYPKSLKETFYTDFETTEPYGGKWLYSPDTGDFRSSSRPDL